ncbi:MAG: DUF6515 family protein [Steroidobacteraceae bacterium]
MTANMKKALLLGALLAAPFCAAQHGVAEARAWHAPRGQIFFDTRYDHGHFYPRVGAGVAQLPPGYRTYFFHGEHWYFAGGLWYVAGPGGFVVARPPVGLTVALLPPFATTVWIAGIPYYYADDVYYRWDPALNSYVIVPASPGADQPGPLPTASTDGLFIYPRNGQTPAQQATDRYECDRWASTQTGFDPTHTNESAPTANPPKAEQYRRAMTACLEARGYSVD